MMRLLLVLLATSFFAAASNAQSNAHRTPANSGKMMFDSYCAPCHGMNGRGDGPAAASLKAAPADLTLLSSNNHGQFPDQRVAAVLRFGVKVPAHGSAAMPIWGPILGWMDGPAQTEYSSQEALRISNLVRYLKTIQAN